MTSCATGCGRTSDAVLCRPCASDLARALGQIDDVVGELETLRDRQARISQRVGARSADRPLPYNADASEMLHVVRNTLSTWVRVLESAPRCADTVPAMARWLGARIERVRGHEAAGELRDEITALVADCWRMVDRPAAPVYAGTCTAEECGGEVYLQPGAHRARCRDCGTRYEPRGLDSLLATAAEQTTHAGAAVRILRVLGYQIGSSTVRSWAQRGQVTPVGVDEHRRPTYRLGDLLAMLGGK